MRRSYYILSAIAFSACMSTNPDGLYEGPVAQGECATEVAQPVIIDSVKHVLDADTGQKADPLFRQNGLNVCRTF